MRFEMVVKAGPTQVAHLEGRIDVNPSRITLQNMEEIVALENRLEALLGFRFHINTMRDERPAKKVDPTKPDVESDECGDGYHDACPNHVVSCGCVCHREKRV